MAARGMEGRGASLQGSFGSLAPRHFQARGSRTFLETQGLGGRPSVTFLLSFFFFFHLSLLVRG